MTRSAARPARQAILARYESTISAFADCLVVGILVLLSLLPIVTGFAGVVAGCAVLRARSAGVGSITPAAFWREMRIAMKSSIGVLLVPTAITLLLVADLIALGAGLGNDPAVIAGFAVLAAIVGVLGLRTAASWRVGARWIPTTQRAFSLLARDARGSLLLFGALATAILLAWLTPALTIVCLGPLVLGAVAVDAHANARATAARTTAPSTTE